MSEIMEKIFQKQTNKEAIKPPEMWNVVFVNDDFTPFNFVEMCLMGIFGKTPEQSFAIAKKVHDQGKCVVGQYSKDIAETKAETVIAIAQQCEHPLQALLEQAS